MLGISRRPWRSLEPGGRDNPLPRLHPTLARRVPSSRHWYTTSRPTNRTTVFLHLRVHRSIGNTKKSFEDFNIKFDPLTCKSFLFIFYSKIRLYLKRSALYVLTYICRVCFEVKGVQKVRYTKAGWFLEFNCITTLCLFYT